MIYTRYVDDITISGPFNILKSGIPGTIATILRGTGLPLNEDKNDGGSLNRKAVVLGLLLSKGRPDVSPDYADETARRLKDMPVLIRTARGGARQMQCGSLQDVR